MRIPKTIYSIKSTIMFVAGLVLFTLFFAIIYTPNYGLSEEAISLGDLGEGEQAVAQWYRHETMCLSITCAIILVVTTLSRVILLLTTHTARIREWEYLLWQLVEVVATALFTNLFLSLYLHLDYFPNLPRVLLIYISIAVYPYTFYWLLSERIDRDLRIAEAQRTILRLRNSEGREEKGMMRFMDDKGNIKLVVGSEHIISIEAAGNYVTILHISGGRLMRYSLRNTLKGIEELCAGSPLVRCHRSYYINLSKVKLLRKTPEGIFAEIDFEGVGDIPVSKSYATEVMARFSEHK